MSEDDWEIDINLGSDTLHDIFRKKGTFVYDVDKDLAIACERHTLPQRYYPDDDISSIASSSVVSSLCSEITFNNVDEFLYNDPPAESPIKKRYPDLPGVVKKLGRSIPEVQDHEDWDDDVEIPAQGISLKPAEKKVYDDHIDFDQDIGPSISQRLIRSQPDNPTPSLPSHPSPPPPLLPKAPLVKKWLCEVEDDDDNMDGVDIPDNMSHFNSLLTNKKTTAAATTPSPTALAKSRIPTSHKSQMLASLREKDDESFADGFDLNDKLFQSKQGGPSKSVSFIPTPQSSKSSKLKSPASSGSRLARPTPVAASLKSRIPELPKRQTPLPKRSFLPTSTTPQRRDTEVIDRQRQRATTRSVLPQEPMVGRCSADGHTLLQQPKTRGVYCSGLDSIDNLNDLRPSARAQSKLTDPKRPWRSRDRSNLRLIQPSDQSIQKECNGMTYDATTRMWRGNESSLLAFNEKSYRRPMLMAHKQQRPSRYAATKTNNMKFDDTLQKWVSAIGPQEECNELDTIEDLIEEPKQQARQISSISRSRVASVVPNIEFRLMIQTKRQMMLDQEMHESLMKNWPLSQQEPHTFEYGHSVGASKYFLTRHF